MVSTDKAVNPISVMGASKRVAELALLRWGGSTNHMRALRLGNILASVGKCRTDLPAADFTGRSRHRHSSRSVQVLPHNERGCRIGAPNL